MAGSVFRPSAFGCLSSFGFPLKRERQQVAEAAHRLRRRLGEPMVELAPAGAGHVGQQAVEDLPAGFVQVEAQVEEVAQEAPGLRDAKGVGAVDPVVQRVGGVDLLDGHVLLDAAGVDPSLVLLEHPLEPSTGRPPDSSTVRATTRS